MFYSWFWFYLHTGDTTVTFNNMSNVAVSSVKSHSCADRGVCGSLLVHATSLFVVCAPDIVGFVE